MMNEVAIAVINKTTHNTKYCPSFGTYNNRYTAQGVCDQLNKLYSESLKKYNCEYYPVDLDTRLM